MTLWRFVLLLIPLAAAKIEVQDQVFCAMDQLATLVSKQEILINELISFKTDYATSSDYFSRKIKMWQEEQQLAKTDVTKYITNPLNAYVLIKRTSSELQHIAKYISSDMRTKLEKLWLYTEDIIGATEGLFRLQVTYKINSSDFANGIIMGQQVRPPLSAHDLFTIGRQALDLKINWIDSKNEDYFAIEYLQMAFDKIRNGEDPDSEVNREEITLSLASVYKKTGQFDKAAATVEFLLESGSKFQNLLDEYLALQKEFGDSKIFVLDPYNEDFERVKYYVWRTEQIYTNQACRGDRVVNNEIKSKLRCRYVSHSAFSKIGPFKLEELHLEPLVYLYYDVMFDSEIEIIKKISSLKLERGTNFHSSHPKGYSEGRITKTAFNEDHEHEVFRTLDRRVTDMCGITSTIVKNLQVQNYGVAGFYHAHWDNRLPTDPDPYPYCGNRFATALFYLSDVEFGGYTVFPYVGVRANPVKGTAVFWFSVKDSGEPEFDMRHASCPVLLGSKWVANRWMYEFGNEFTRPCPPGAYTGVTQQASFLDKYF